MSLPPCLLPETMPDLLDESDAKVENNAELVVIVPECIGQIRKWERTSVSFPPELTKRDVAMFLLVRGNTFFGLLVL
jgi:hypothetical protein